MRDKLLKIGRIALQVFLYLFLALALFSVVLAIASKKDADGAAEIFGYQFRLVRSDSMAECEQTDVSDYDIGSIPVRSMVFVQTVPDDPEEAEKWYSEIEVGDVLTFRYQYTSQETITHRVTNIEEKASGGYIISLAGDNKASEDSNTLTQTIDTSKADTDYNYIIGKVTGQSYPLGLLVYALRSPVGIVCIVIVPSAIIIAIEIVRIVSVLGEEKRKKQKEESQQKEDEIESLKKQLEMLQSAVGLKSAQSEATETTEEKTDISETATDAIESDEENKEEIQEQTEKIEE